MAEEDKMETDAAPQEEAAAKGPEGGAEGKEEEGQDAGGGAAEKEGGEVGDKGEGGGRKGDEGGDEEEGEGEGEEEEEEEAEEAISPKKSPKKAEAKTPKKDAKPEEKKRKAKKEEESEEEEEEEEDDKQAGAYWNIDTGTKRQRKSLEHFHPESTNKDKVDIVEKILQQGKGKALKDIPTVMDSIKNHTISKADKNDHLKMLSQLIFKKTFPPRELKENLLSFSGMVFEDQKQDENWCGRINKRTIVDLKGMLGCLHLERSGTQKELSERLISFLKKPSTDMATKGKAVAGSKKRKSSSGTKKATPKTSKPKKKASKKKKDDESEEESEEEEEEEEEKETKKTKPAAKKAKKAKADDDDSADEPLTKGGMKEKLVEYVNTICSKEDLSTLTLRMVREKLESDFKVDIAEHKDKIKQIVNDYVAKHSA